MIIVYISNAASNKTLESFEKKYAKRPMRFVQQWWDYGMASALNRLCKDSFSAISFPPVSTFPSSKCIRTNEEISVDDDGLEIYIPSVWNLPVIKQRNLSRAIYRQIKKICRSNPDQKLVILTHCIYLQSAKPAFKLRKKYPNVSVFTIVPDLPEHATAVNFKGHAILQKLHRYYVKKTVALSDKFDGYICFSKPQMEHLNSERPYIVMEGYIDTAVIDAIAQADPAPNRIVYAGGLMYRYGIRELVDGFVAAGIPSAELYIYGLGEAEEYVKGKESLGVYYGGSVSREEIIAIEKSAFLLVNPRPTVDEYSRCSFPSKLMEYMASGTPVLTSRLGCIGEEYFDKLNFVEEVTPDEISKALKDCFTNKDELIEKAARASQYIREYKNADHQASVIAEFLASYGGK